MGKMAKPNYFFLVGKKYDKQPVGALENCSKHQIWWQ